MTIWNDERRATVRKLWAEGLTCSQIADRLGHGISRSAVIGIVHRMDLGKRVTRIQTRSAKPAPGVGWRKFVSTPKPQRAESVGSAGEPVRYDNTPAPVGQRQQVHSLEGHHCRWPIGDPQRPDFHFCGGRKVNGLPYCEFHARKAFVAREKPVAQRISNPPRQTVLAAE